MTRLATLVTLSPNGEIAVSREEGPAALLAAVAGGAWSEAADSAARIERLVWEEEGGTALLRFRAAYAAQARAALAEAGF